jgi:hypothetical protein
VGAIVDSVSSGRWCEEQGSLMRAFAFGILDPDGDRYRLADAHRKSRKSNSRPNLALRFARRHQEPHRIALGGGLAFTRTPRARERPRMAPSATGACPRG